MVVFDTQVICDDVVQPDSFIPGRHEEELARVGPKLAGRDSILRQVLQFHFIGGLGKS